MAEMNRVSRFFVNRSSARRNARIYDWVRANLSLPAGAACLEIGCGNGDMAARLVDGFRPARYIATDLDPHQLEAASQTLAKRYPGGLPPALELRVANMLDLPFPDASFDAVFAFVAIHHASPKHRDFANVPRALAEINRVLKPKGSLVYEEIEHKERIRRWLMERGTPSRRFSEDGNANRSSPRKSGRRRSRRTNEPTLSDEWTDSGLRFPGRSRKIPSSRHAGSTIRAF